jgi:hypothetical protein
MSKLWQKTTNVNKLVENFTVGRDRELDREMAAFDVLGFTCPYHHAAIYRLDEMRMTWRWFSRS